MYEKDYPKYVFYNAIDTALVYLIHKKINTMDIALTFLIPTTASPTVSNL